MLPAVPLHLEELCPDSNSGCALRNEAEPDIYLESWLDRLSDINNDSKHVRLTPQRMDRASALKLGTFSAERIVIEIEYVAPHIYVWSLVDRLPSHLASSHRLAVSNKLYWILRKAQHINQQDARP